MVDSTRWFRKKKRMQNDKSRHFPDMTRAPLTRQVIRTMERIVLMGSNREWESATPWLRHSLEGTGYRRRVI